MTFEKPSMSNRVQFTQDPLDVRHDTFTVSRDVGARAAAVFFRICVARPRSASNGLDAVLDATA